MSVLTYGDVISRTRNRLKVDNQDSFITDRVIWSYLRPWINQVMRELDSKNKLMAFNSLFDTLDIVPLIEVDRIEAGCAGLKTGYTFMRTREPIGELFMEGYWGNMIRSITSIDSSEQLQPISPSGYNTLARIPSFKYNKTLYYWYLNDFIYFPNVSWGAVRIEAIVEEDISEYKCDDSSKCLLRQEQSFNVPDYILARAESLMMQSLGINLQISADHQPDNISNNK